MKFESAEDRLNPMAPPGADETTLGGYPLVHGRAPAFEGSDGRPYTAAVETEATDHGDPPWVAYLVFVRWADTGNAVMGHIETDDLVSGGTEAEVRTALESLPLSRVKTILDETIARKQREESRW